MQLEIDRLRRRLRRERWRRAPSNSKPSFNDDRDGSYRPRLRTPLVSLSRVMRITIISAEIRARLAKV